MYHEVIGNYLLHIRPDIVYTMSVISQFINNLKEVYAQAAYRVLHYLKGAPQKCIMFERNDRLTIETYAFYISRQKMYYRLLYLSWG